MSKVDKFQIKKRLKVGNTEFAYFSLPGLKQISEHVSRLPLASRIILESMIRNASDLGIPDDKLISIIKGDFPHEEEISFRISRVLMQDLTGVPAIVDLASMREKFRELRADPAKINPAVPVDLVIDHSVQVDFFGSEKSFNENRAVEFERNRERYRFLKWASRSFSNVRVIPPSVGIVHQVNLEYLADVVSARENGSEKLAIFDTLVGTDSHTTMVNGIGVLGWGVGGIEAEAAMLGEPITLQYPVVVGVNLHGRLRPGIVATDLVLYLTRTFRKANVVGKIIEFYGDGVSTLSAADRSTVSNMCPEYGATSALFPVDENTLEYLRLTGRSEDRILLVKAYLEAQEMFGVPKDLDYDEIIDVNLEEIETSVSGPSLPQQQAPLGEIGNTFLQMMEEQGTEQQQPGKQRTISLRSVPVEIRGKRETLTDGDVVIAAITSCTNTSNPKVMIAAGILAKKACELGLTVNPKVKTSLAPGSRVVTDYLKRAGLDKYLEKLGFYLVGYGCTTCIGNSGPLPKEIEEGIKRGNLSVASVLSGNRNFQARIHSDVRANYLMSPPLVVAFAIAGSVVINLEKEPVGKSGQGKPVYLRDIWPSNEEIDLTLQSAMKESDYAARYSDVENSSGEWSGIEVIGSETYKWEEGSTYIRNPPYFRNFHRDGGRKFEDIQQCYPLLVMGDSVTTDHISPAGSISAKSVAGQYLISKGVKPEDFNSFGARRGNHEVMMRGTFANSRIRNFLVDKEGATTVFIPEKRPSTIYDAAMEYARKGIPLTAFAGKEYGTGSSRDWAAKGPYLLGIRAVIAESFERIHRSNLAGMGIIPLQFAEGENAVKLAIDFMKPVAIRFDGGTPSSATLEFTNHDGEKRKTKLRVRLDTPVEYEYFRYGGILQYVMGQILKEK